MRAATARWLIENTNLRAAFAARGRAADRAVFVEILQLVRLAAATSDSGSSAASTGPAPGESKLPWRGGLGVREAAQLIGITPRAVRLAIEQKRLPAQVVGGIYVVSEDDAHEFARTRRRRAAA